uniref:UDP-glucuronosyltransferase 3A2-like isoform X1 n=1 Tax=Jaculus jaculus TaxID=51337 RepID=UPI001E1B4B70|nr:UDP-glucuronosyltransferase 3A2-like isoform X1 [Jaculus jaculus]
MAGPRALLLVSFFLGGPLFSEAAKILTISTLGGSHHLQMQKISQILQEHGHWVTNLLYNKDFISDFKRPKKEVSYQVIPWSVPEEQQKKFNDFRDFLYQKAVDGRSTFNDYLMLYEHLGILCSHLLSRRDIMDSLRNENFDLFVFDSIDLCSFLVAEKLEKPFVVFLSVTFMYVDFGLPNPLSYVPVTGSFVTENMDFWGRVRNVLMYFVFSMKQRLIHSQFDNAIREHFAEGSRPVLSHLLRKAELWFVNSDFGFDFARPLLPNTIYIGGLMDKPVNPLSQDLEDFIAKFGDSGFVLIAQGSILSMYQTKKHIEEMNKAFSNLPQGVIWKFNCSQWPEDVKLPANVKMMDWVPQNDLLAHPRIRLFVTHGGINSIMESMHHGVPIVGIPVTADQPENMLRVEAKKFGVSVHLQNLRAETLALKMKEVIEDERYKSAAMAARAIMRSHPLTPAQRLVGWIDHILQTGGAVHLKPYAFQQPWHEQYLLDVLLFLLGLILGTLWLCWKLLGFATRWLCGARKLKKT